MGDSVAILLSTYNGDKFLNEQIDSIINQDYENWKLYIRDDGSSDNTLSIIQDYVSNYDNIFLIKEGGNLGAAGSFMFLLDKVDSKYYMFCDQDDFWFFDKISSMYDFFEKKYLEDNDLLLVFSDATVTDESCKPIEESFWHYNRVYPQLLIKNKNFIKVFNCAPGCTMFFTKKIKDFLDDYDTDIIMHDWYLFIKALYNGNVDYLNKSKMFYRQHESNVVGANHISLQYFKKRMTQLKKTIHQQSSTYRFVKKYAGSNFLEYYFLKLRFVSKRILNLLTKG